MNMPLVLLNRRRRGGSFSPASLFSSTAIGIWLDPSDVANLTWRRNLLTWTEQFDNAVWTKNGLLTVSANTSVAPDGTTTAERLTEDTSTGEHRAYQNFASTTLGSAYALSFYAKAAGRTLVTVTSNSAVMLEATFDIQNGTVTSNTGGIASISSAGSGWYRIEVRNTASAATSTNVQIRLVSSGTNTSYTGDGTSGIFVWGAQFEQSSVATDYQRISDVNTEVIERFPNATMFQDAAGTTAVTTPGQPVGLRLDKSKGLALGPELITNGDFSSGTTGWASGASATIAVTAGSLVVTKTTGVYPAGNQTLSGLTIGKAYRITCSFSNPSGLDVYTGFSATLSVSRSTATSGTLQCILIASATSHIAQVGIWDGSGATGQSASFDNVSVKELPGNHATQSVLASRPVYGIEPKGGRRNLLLATDDFLTSLPGTVATTNNQSPTGALNAYGFTETTDNIQRSAAIANTATNQTRSFYVRRTAGVSTRYLAILATNVAAGGAFFNLATGTVTTNNPANFTATIQLVGDFWRCSITRVDAVNSDLMLCITSQNTVYSGSQAYTGDGVSKFVIWGAQLEAGTALTNYERVTTAFDVTEAGVQSCHYVQYDGSDDSMSTAAIDFTATDKMSVFAGVRMISNTSAAIVIETSTTSDSSNGSLSVWRPSGNNGTQWYAQSRGTSLVTAFASGYAAPSTHVFGATSNISGDSLIVRVNGTQVAQSTADQGTGNFGNYPLFIGRRNNASLPFNGKDYGILVVGKAVTPTEITDTETWLAARTAQVTL